MKTLTRLAAVASISIAAISLPAGAAMAQGIQGIGIVMVEAVRANSAAFKAAQQQTATTYKAQIDSANARRTAISQQLEPLYQALQTAAQQPNADRAALVQQQQQIQQIEAAGQRELQTILQPVALSQAYVDEQINEKLAEAIEAAAKKNNVTLVTTPDTVLYADNRYSLNQAVLTELDAALPSVQITPPAGWLPREQREQQAAAQAAAAQQGGAAQPAAQPVEGR